MKKKIWLLFYRFANTFQLLAGGDVDAAPGTHSHKNWGHTCGASFPFSYSKRAPRSRGILCLSFCRGLVCFVLFFYYFNFLAQSFYWFIFICFFFFWIESLLHAINSQRIKLDIVLALFILHIILVRYSNFYYNIFIN